MSVIKANGAGSAASDFYSYKIDQSLRFNDGDSPYLTRDPSSAGDRQKFTYSVWFKRNNLNAEMDLFSAGDSSTDRFEIILSAAYPDQLEIYMNTSGTIGDLVTTQKFRDVSAWYHLVVAFDTTQGTAANRVKVYINGSQITSFATETYPSQNFNTAVNSTSNQYISKRNYVDDRYYDGYMAEVNMIDGQQLTPASFGETKDGVWVPKSSSGLTFGTNGFYLPFDDSSAIGDDESSNTNDFTANNLAATDVVPDSPTNNWCTLNQNLPDSYFNTDQLSEGNLFYNEGEGNDGDGHPTATFSVTSGKWYWEVQVPSQQNSRAIGFTRTDNIGKGNVTLHGNGFTSANSVVGIDLSDDTIDQVDKAGTHTQEASGLTGMSNNDIFGLSVDLDGGTFQMYRNGSAYGSSYNLDDLADWQTHGMTPTASGKTYMAYRFNFGQDSTFAGATTAGGNQDDNGVGNFKYAPPSGHLALCTANLPDPTVGPTADTLATDNFNTVLYTGPITSTAAAGTTGAVTGVGFQPDWVWIKVRSTLNENQIFDSVRGVTTAGIKSLVTDTTAAETSGNLNGGIYSLDSDGFTVVAGTDGGGRSNLTGSSDRTYVAWNWKAGGSASSNSDGDITSSVSANTAAGFSIATFTKGSGVETVGHGLSVAPDLLIVKRRNGTGSWYVYHSGAASDAETDYLRLNDNDEALDNATLWGDTAPTTSVFSVGAAFNSSETLVCYAFHSVKGYSKFGSYTGNGADAGPFVFTGFRPAWVLIKRSDSADNWMLMDNKRTDSGGGNVIDKHLRPDSSAAENDPGGSPPVELDFLSNGFKHTENNGQVNASGGTYIYLAFAEAPFKFANAR